MLNIKFFSEKQSKKGKKQSIFWVKEREKEQVALVFRKNKHNFGKKKYK